jgi:hypothetical protein
VAAACALAAAREGPTRLADLRGDQPAILGLAADPPTGLREWLAVGPEAPTEALDRLAIDVVPSLSLLPAGSAPIVDVPAASGAALAVALDDRSSTTVVDAGVPDLPAVDALVDVCDHCLVVVRGCYLALRRAVRLPAITRACGAVLVEEPGRALGAREISDVLNVPVVATVTVRSSVARVVDAGVLPARAPESLLRPARQLLQRVGVVGREGRAA